MYSKGYPSPYSGPVTVEAPAPALSTFEYNPPFNDWVNIPDGASEVVVEMWGGGGAGQQGGATSSGAGRGGGGGGYIKADITGALFMPGAKVHIEVGIAGLFSDPSGDGGNTIVTDNSNYTLEANGGLFAGKGGSANTPGFGGIIYLDSDPGDTAANVSSTYGTAGGKGGGPAGGSGGAGGKNSQNGFSATAKGGGGGGGGAFGPTDGGDGAPGLVILSYMS